MTVKARKKLIEVALPLEAINVASAREKSIRHGHPSTLHLWWARRPLAAARAVIFAQMVDDPSAYVDTLLGIPESRRAAERELKKRRDLWDKRKAEFEAATGREEVAIPEPGPEPTLEDCAADIERQRLFRIIEDLVKWENSTNEAVLETARSEIWQSWRRACADNADHSRARELFDRHKLPAFHDPFAGGGALPLEAQRLGLEAYASDLNPVAVLINKAMIEIPPKFAGQPPVNPKARGEKSLDPRQWKGAQGLAEDVRYYGQWMRDEAEKRIGHLYPKVEITAEMAKERPDLKPYLGRKLTVIAWLWARTVKSSNPAFRDVDVPLATTFMLGTKPGKEAYLQPVVKDGKYEFIVKVGKPQDGNAAKRGTKSGGSGSNFVCLMSGIPLPFEYLRQEAKAKRMGARLLAIVAEGDRGRVYLPATADMEQAVETHELGDLPEVDLPVKALGFRVQEYGMTRWCDLFTNRQLVALSAFSDLVQESRDLVYSHAVSAQNSDPNAYADGIAVYLALAVGRLSDYSSTICTWANNPQMEIVRGTFARQALPMTWDYAEANVFGPSTGSIDILLSWITKAIVRLPANQTATVFQQDATRLALAPPIAILSTDPPYYDNIGYADLSDFFYFWLRRALRSTLPDIFSTLTTPKSEELIASPFRQGAREEAEAFFLKGMTSAMRCLAAREHPAFPVTIYYAFKQSEGDDEKGTASTGWDTFLGAAMEAGFSITGTWPIRTERSGHSISIGTNALASSIVLVCRPRPAGALIATRRDFLNNLKIELPAALAHLQRGNIAPVDLAQAAIGPGMAVYTRYVKVMDAEGKRLSVRQALALINQELDEVLAKQEGDFDAESRFAIAWFEHVGFADGEFGVADVLARAKNTAVAGLVEAGIAVSKAGKVRLLRPEELSPAWDPVTDPRLTVWEIVHHLIRVVEADGEAAAAALAAKLGIKAEIARELAYRLYTVCERKKRAAEALSYNGLVQSWPEIMRLVRETAAPSSPVQADLAL